MKKKDIVSELHYNFKLYPGFNFYRKSLFNYISVLKGTGSIIYNKSLQNKSVLLHCLNSFNVKFQHVESIGVTLITKYRYS